MAIALAVAAVMLLIPVGPQDWGDDFALYILQAVGFAGHDAPARLFVMNPAYTAIEYSPSAYPPGFPILLAPVYAVAGVDLHAFQVFMSVLLLATGVVTYRYASRRLGYRVAALAVALVVIFHVDSLDLKQFVLSDIPFTLFAIAFLEVAEAEQALPLAVVLVVVAWLMRSAGIVLVIAWGCDAVIRTWLRRAERLRTHGYLLAAIAAALMVGGLWFLMRDAQGYDTALQTVHPFSTIGEQYASLSDWIGFYVGSLAGFALRPFVMTALAVLLALGAWMSWREGRTLALWFCALYATLLLGYPHPRGGYRLILPLLPVLWTYVARGWLVIAERIPAKTVTVHAFALALLVLTARQVYAFSTRPASTHEYPESPAAAELYAAMERAIEPDALTLSGRPRALALFTHRRGISLSPQASDEAVEKLVADFDVKFVIAGDPLRNAAISRYCAEHPDRVIFHNDSFAICRTR